MIVQKQINELKSNIEQQTTDKLQRMAKLNELKITGIAHTNEENLNEIFKAIAQLMDFDLKKHKQCAHTHANFQT